jgi:hypothetical protein
MAKKNVTYVARAAFIAIAEKLGAKVEEQKGFVKLTAAGVEDKAVYVGNTPNVGRVDISGFIPTETAGLVRIEEKNPTSRVLFQLDMSKERGEGEILKAFAVALKKGLLNKEIPALPKLGFGQKVPAPAPEAVDAMVSAALADIELEDEVAEPVTE